ALSHRWGLSRHLTTTKENLEDHFDKINMSNLPATFRDAVLVTRRLGIAYLWIDALCIVQNDEEWLHESEIMGDIFHGAVCTIAVHTAQDDSCGFLKEASQPVSAIQAAKGPSDSQLFISTSSDFVRDVENSSLSGRAWVLQERHLSQRLLHFTDSHIYWEDHKGIQSDMVPVQWPFKTFHLHCLPPYSSSSSIGAWREENWKTLSRQWLKLVEMYSVCGITKDKDKLPAISGLAKRYHRVAGNGYLAGIWGENIHWGLLWSIKELIPSRPSYERAPSWSWASSDGTI
ncbi:HET-domain-containing protein, partial [Cadophora sp. DSE1049]